MFGGLFRKMPFCYGCFRYLTPEEARAHSKHARLIRWQR